MLDIHDIEHGISEIKSAEKLTPTTCATLASLYYIKDHMADDTAYRNIPAYHQYSQAAYSLAEQPAISAKVEISGNSEFLRSVTGKDVDAAWAVVDELMDNLKLVNPRVYDSVIAKLQAL